MRRSTFILALVALHIICGHADVPAFTTQKYPSTNTVSTQNNGILITLNADTGGSAKAYSYFLSDAFSQTAVIDMYVTVLCTNGPIDMGLAVGAVPTLGSAALAGGGAASMISDLQSAWYPGYATGTGSSTTVAADQYVIAPGQTIRYTVDPTVGSKAYTKVDIKDSTGNSIQGAPCNIDGTSTTGTGKMCSSYKGANIRYGLEALNGGMAIFCVQTPAQYAISTSCDGGNTKATACTSTAATGTTYTVTAFCASPKLVYRGGCVSSCTTGSYAYASLAVSCVDCPGALSNSLFCSRPAAAASSGLLRVGQIAAMFVGSIFYFVLFG